MAYRSDGSSHRDGIKNELNTAKILEVHSNELFGDSNITVSHLGGTQHKADLVVDKSDNKRIKVSVKRKKKITTGSFDYINTSKLPNSFTKVLDIYTKGYKMGVRDQNLINELKLVITDELNNLDSDTLFSFLEESVVKANKEITMVINDTENEVIYKYDFNDSPIVELMKDGFKPTIKKNDKMSKNILFVRNDETRDIGLRIRLNLNNGWGAWLGTNGKKTSVLTIKIQQDKVKNLLDDIKNKQVLSY